MKKFYLFFSLSVLVASLFGQEVFQTNTRDIMFNSGQVRVAKKHMSANKAYGNVIWESDFSNKSDWNANGGWVIDSIEPVGQYTAWLGKIASTSGGNFAMIDKGNPTNITNGVNGDMITMANPVDLSSLNAVEVTFEYQYRDWKDEVKLVVSTDGSNWTEVSIPGIAEMSTNDLSENGELAYVDVTSYLAGVSTAYIGFKMTVTQEDIAYVFQADDFKILEGAVNAVSVEAAYSTWSHIWGNLGTYYAIPRGGAEDSILFNPRVTNEGLADQHDVKCVVKVLNGSTVVYTDSVQIDTLPVGYKDSILYFNNLYLPMVDSAVYLDFCFSVTQKEVEDKPFNNYDTIFLAMKDTIYSRARLGTTHVSDMYYNDAQGNVAGGEGSVLGNSFSFAKEEGIMGVRLYVSPYSNNGFEIVGQIRDKLATNKDVLAESPVYTIKESDINKSVYLKFDEPYIVNIEDTTLYIACYEIYSSPSADSSFVVWADDEYDQYYQRSSNLYTQGDATWYYISLTPWVDMVTTPIDYSVGSLQSGREFVAFPNPAEDQVVVKNAQDMKIEVYSINGVMMNTINKAKDIERINVSSYASGLYFIKVYDNSSSSTIKVIVQ